MSASKLDKDELFYLWSTHEIGTSLWWNTFQQRENRVWNAVRETYGQTEADRIFRAAREVCNRRVGQ